MSKFWSKRVQELDPYTPGEQPQDQQYIKLNTNENPYPPSPKAIEAMQNASDENMRLYPDPNCHALKQAIAEYYALPVNQVFVGNSSDEVLAHTFVALLKHDKPLLYPDISYSFYPCYCKLFGINATQIPLAEDFTIQPKDYEQENGGIVFPNPNAPSGILLSLGKIEEILKANPDSVIVIDEAYIDFGGDTAIPLIAKYPNLLITQTFSKSRSLAGLRVGFALGQKELIEGLERVKNSFNAYPLDRAALQGSIASINDKKYFEETCKKIIKTREETTAALEKMNFTVLPSKTNFIFAKPNLTLNKTNAKDLYLKLKEEGVLVRYFNAPRVNEFLRITIGTDEEMRIFLDKIAVLK